MPTLWGPDANPCDIMRRTSGLSQCGEPGAVPVPVPVIEPETDRIRIELVCRECFEREGWAWVDLTPVLRGRRGDPA